MEVAHVLHMNGGVGYARYANNSFVRQKAICLSKPIREEALTSLYCNTLPRSLAIADLGCSSGPNTLSVMSEFIKTVEKLCRKLNHKSPEYKVFLNDLLGNDFNNIFMPLNNFKEKLCDEIETGGWFYCRVFPNQSLHFVHSSYSLHWLSKRITKEEQLDTFNIPQYTPSPSEVKLEVLKEGSFAINRLELAEVNWNTLDDWNALDFESERSKSLSDNGYNLAQCMRCVAEPMLDMVRHFGEDIIEEVWFLVATKTLG